LSDHNGQREKQYPDFFHLYSPYSIGECRRYYERPSCYNRACL
jgi:hypothetical protein